MHYCCEIVTKEFPTDRVIADVLSPFRWELHKDDEPQPVFTWDSWGIGGRYSGKLKLALKYEANQYEWGHFIRTPRAGRLFRSKALETIDSWSVKSFVVHTEEDLFNELGARDGYIRVDGARIGDLIDFEKDCAGCWCLIDVDGKAYARVHYEEDPEFEQTVQNIFANGNRDDCYVVIVDLHD